MLGFFALFALTFLLDGLVLAATPDQWRGQSIYQIMTDRFARTDGSTTAPCNVTKNEYCGGTWKGIENNLDYVQDMGFTAIWISPVTANTPTGYHGYYQTDLYSLNSHFGTEQDLRSLSHALHQRGMYLMVDVVTNHFGSLTNEPAIDHSAFNPFNSSSYFHPYCAIDYDNQTSAEICWLYTNLLDVKTEEAYVVQAFSSWISWLVEKYSIDGLRIDSVKDVDKASLPPFCEAAGVYCLGELSNGNADYVYPYQDVLNGGGIINYPIYDAFLNTFIERSATTADLAYNVYLDRNNSIDSGLHGTFTENHDNPRIGHLTADLTIAANAIGWTFLTDGIPIIYQGQEQHLSGADDPYCREAMWLASSGSYNVSAPLHGTTAYLNQIRTWASSQSSTFLKYQNIVLDYSNNQISMRKDVVRSILTFAGASQARGTYTTKGAGFTAGETVVEMLSCTQYTASSNGEVTANTGYGAMVVLLPASFLSGSGMCGFT